MLTNATEEPPRRYQGVSLFKSPNGTVDTILYESHEKNVFHEDSWNPKCISGHWFHEPTDFDGIVIRRDEALARHSQVAETLPERTRG